MLKEIEEIMKSFYVYIRKFLEKWNRMKIWKFLSDNC